MSVIRIAFLGTPEFAREHLAALLEDSHFEVAGVVTQPDRPKGRNMRLAASPVKELALRHNLKVIAPESIKIESAMTEIISWKAEAAVVVAYGQILPQKFLDLFPLRVVNVHASLLPRWRGAAPIQRAVQAGDKVTGVSLQVMKRKLDAGDIIGSYKCEIDQKTNSIGLHDQLIPLGVRLLKIDFMDYLRGNLTPLPQDETLVTYAHKIEKSEAKFSWSLSATEIYNHIRAMVMGPGSLCVLGGKTIKIIEAAVGEAVGDAIGEEKKDAPGTVIEVGKNYFDVICGVGVLRVLEVKPESRAKMSVKEFLLGHPVKKGDHFL